MSYGELSGGEVGAGLAPFAGLIRSLSADHGVTHHSLAACGFRFQTGTGSIPPTEAGGMGMLAEEVDFVIGVDTHRDAHVWAVLVADTGAIVAEGR